MIPEKNGNLFSGIPNGIKEEVFETLLRMDSFSLERIISHGQVTPQGQWLKQEANEWVVLLSGSAKIVFEDREDVLIMKPGDYVHVPAQRRHRVEWTDSEQTTVWLALHYKPGKSG